MGEPIIEDHLSLMAPPMNWNTTPSSEIQNLINAFDPG